MIIDLDKPSPIVRQIAKSEVVALSPHCLVQKEKRKVKMDDIMLFYFSSEFSTSSES
jgi:hypothetical protein